MKISELLRVIDSDANMLTQKFFQQCAYVRKDGELFDYEDVEVKRITAKAFDKDDESANTFYLHID